VFRIAEKVAESFPGLRGYVGVDFVLTQHKAFVVDVNPRLTTSYVGLRRIAGFNVVEALVDAVVKGKLPSKHETRGYACFSKIKTPTPTVDVFQKTAKSAEVVSPPFPLTDNAASCALVIGEGSSLEVALQRLEEAKKHLLNIFT
jgi:predicted ATP-grasp superfamily ATP-dependent carboligase